MVAILDSGGDRGDSSRYLIAAFDPFEIVEAFEDEVRLATATGEQISTSLDVLQLLDDRLKTLQRVLSPQHPIAGACIATFAYELGHQLQPTKLPRTKSPGEPDATLMFYDTLLVHDYHDETTTVVSVAGKEGLERAIEAIGNAAPCPDASIKEQQCHLFSEATSDTSRDGYLQAVERIKNHIARGDIYQANLTQQLTVKLGASLTPERIFTNLRRWHPSSFGAFIRRPGDCVISASPERFLKVSFEDAGRYIQACPIKGTRPRGGTVQQDEQLRKELLESEKDRAENIMIVDLVRNDLGRVCEYGTVRVEELCAIQEHPTLFHLVSKISGTLRPEVTASEILRAAFPCGSITGAPKIRAMQILDEIEPSARGLSMGSIGYFSFDGRMDLNVAIRTMTVDGGTARFNVGGGVVADSDPEAEYKESLLKAKALLRALDSD